MEELIVTSKDKRSVYEEILPQIEAIIDGENDLIANLANVAAILREAFDLFWVGFYLVKKRSDSVKELVLGPFQGPLACTRISYGRGVCGSAWERGETLVVPDVELFPGHIACSSLSRSEIVVPVLRGGEVVAVLDIDSRELASFDETDAEYLERVVAMDALNFDKMC